MKRLHILIYVTHNADAIDINHELTEGLARHLSTMADVTLSTNYHDKALTEGIPYDILHIFGSWSHTAARAVLRAHALHIPTVITPLGGFQPWVMRTHQDPRLQHLQRRMVTLASAVHVCGILEQETFSHLGWNGRTALIKNPVLTSQLTFDDMAQQMTALYRKVLDSNARLLLSDNAQQTIGALLTAGASTIDDKLDIQRGVIHGLLLNLTDDDWRQLLIYSHDEQTDEILRTGLLRMGYTPPAIDVDAIDRFPRPLGYGNGNLKGDLLLSKNLLIRNKLSETVQRDEHQLRHVCIQWLNFRYELDHGRAPLLHLVNLYQTTRYEDIDEDRLQEAARALGIDEFAGRLMSVMHRLFQLTEGFMPFPLHKDDKDTRKLWTDVTKFNTY